MIIKTPLSAILISSSATLLIMTISGITDAAVMSGGGGGGGGYEIEADIFSSGGRRHTTDGIPRGYVCMWSAGGFPSGISQSGEYDLENGFEFFNFAKSVWQEKISTRTGANSFGFSGDASWQWQVPALMGTTIYLDAYIRLSDDYPQGDAKPKIILRGPGVDGESSATVLAYTSWEKLTIEATPSKNTVLILEAQGNSTAEGARFYIDDISIRH